MHLDTDEIFQKVNRLMALYAQGALGGETMPEDANPRLPKDAALNYAYFTLPMALNYQRNSYALWKCAHESYLNPITRPIFDPHEVSRMALDQLRALLMQYKVALQPNRHPLIWQTIGTAFSDLFDGDVRNLFTHCDYSAQKTKDFLIRHKRQFPYLSGPKISNYWLYVMQQYTDLKFTDRQNISVAPDTHVIQASVKLGVISGEEAAQSGAQQLVAQRWETLLKNTAFQPIDVHTPLWLWSRGKFAAGLYN